MYLGPACWVRQRVPFGAVRAESLSPEQETVSGCTEGSGVLRAALPRWGAPHNLLSLGCFWTMTPGRGRGDGVLPRWAKSQPSWLDSEACNKTHDGERGGQAKGTLSPSSLQPLATPAVKSEPDRPPPHSPPTSVLPLSPSRNLTARRSDSRRQLRGCGPQTDDRPEGLHRQERVGTVRFPKNNPRGGASGSPPSSQERSTR